MEHDRIVFTIFLIFSGATVLATVALYLRQSILVSYIFLGAILGPWGVKLVPDLEVVQQASSVGIMFLLFLLGLNLHPQELLKLFRETTVTAGVSSLLFALLGCLFARLFGFTWLEASVIGAAMMFSSTIIGLKLLPTTVLHHQQTGEIMISILLLQDLIAIIILLLLEIKGQGEIPIIKLLVLIFSLPGLILFSFLFTKYILMKLIKKFQKIREYIFLLAIGWCLGIAEAASMLGLSHEAGAFIAGVALATSPISLFIAESLKPLRDFFLVMFFFSIGASFDLTIIQDILIPGVLLALLALVLKPFVFYVLLKNSGKEPKQAKEIGIRLGQISEFSFLIAVLALDLEIIKREASYLIQASALLSFIVSSYFIVIKYPTPIAISDKLRRD